MRRYFAWVLLIMLLLQSTMVYAESMMRIEDKAYDLEVRSMYMHTSANGKYRVLRTESTTGLQCAVNSIVLEYDYEKLSKERIGRYEVDAPVALVTVDGFDDRLAQLAPEEILLTVNGLPVEAEPYADVYGHIGWEDVLRSGSRSAVFPIVLTREGGAQEYAVRVQGIVDGVRITETAKIRVQLINTHEYKPEKEAKILHIESEEAEVYIVGDTIYADHPVGQTEETKVSLCFADENGKLFDGIAWAESTVCAAENMQAALYLAEDVKLDENSRAVYRLASGCARERRDKVRFTVQTKDALYRTKEYSVAERFGIEKDDPKGIYFAQAEKVLCVGGTYEPVVLSVSTNEVLRSGMFGKLTIAAGGNTDAQVIDVSDGKRVIGVKPGEAYITARYACSGVVYETASMKITVAEDRMREMTVLCRKLNIRAGAGLAAQKVGSLRRGDKVQVMRIENGWAQLADGCYVCAEYIK